MMHKCFRSLHASISLILAACLLCFCITGCTSKDNIMKPYTPMGDTKEADATAEFSYTNDIDKPVKRVDGVSGNTIFIKDDSEYDTAEITAGQALLVNLTNGEVILSKQALTAIPAGNFTKLFAAYVVFSEEDDLSRTISISQDTNNLSSNLVRCKFQKDDTYKIEDLLYASIMYCANDAVIALALGHPGGSISSFVKNMNALSEDLNLKSTEFSNIYGYPVNGSKQETTLLDVFTVTREMLEKYPTFTEIISKQVYFCTYQNSKSEPLSVNWNSALPYYNTEENYALPEHLNLELIGGICEPASSAPTQICCVFRDYYGTMYLALLAGCTSYEHCYEQMQYLVTRIPAIY